MWLCQGAIFGQMQTPGVEAIVFNRVKNLIILLLDSKQKWRKVTHEKFKD
jgi:hypothetical protein